MRQAAAESLYVYNDENDVRAPVDMAGLEVVDLQPDQLDTFVDLARRLDDGEAATLALAFHSGITAVTDDKRAAREAAQLAPPVETIGTARVLRLLQAALGLSDVKLSFWLLQIERRARFRPTSRDSDNEWWQRIRTLARD